MARDPSTGCLLWQHKVDAYGYGVMSPVDGIRRAHRFAWHLANGQIPSGMVVRHKCHRPSCCEPSHLEIGTDADNMADMMSAGRHATQKGTMRPATGPRHGAHTMPERVARGERSGVAKLKADDVVAIREAYAAGQIAEEIAPRFGIHPDYIYAIVRGQSWRHVGGPVATPEVAAHHRARGSKSGRAKFTDADVARLRSDYAAGRATAKEIATSAGAAPSAVLAMLVGTTWAHIPGAVARKGKGWKRPRAHAASQPTASVRTG